MSKPNWIARDYQRSIRDFMFDIPRANIWAGTGVGKTSTALFTYEQLRLFGEVDRLLVISTKRIASMVWPNEIKKWGGLEHLSMSVAVGTASQRLAAIRQKTNICCVNFEVLPWLVDTVGVENWPWDIVIADESTELRSLRIDLRKSSTGKEFLRKSGGGIRAAKIAQVAHKKVRHWYNLTGEPAPNGLIDMWPQCWYVDAGAALGRTFTAFQERWFRQVRVDDYQFKLEPTAYADPQIKEAIKPYTITIEAKDYFDLPPTLINKVYVQLPKAAREKYREMEKEFFTKVQKLIESGATEVEVEAFASGGKSIKCRQIASGAVIHDSESGEWVEIHDEKIEAARDIIRDLNGAPVLIAYEFKSDLARLKKAFPKAVYFDDNPQTLADFCAGRIPVLLLHPKSAAHGIDGMQKVCRDVIWFSQTWRLDLFRQLNERVGAMRQVSEGFYREVRIHLLIAEDTVEDEMVWRVDGKGTVNDALKMAMKRRGA